ncbi:hypothetical protein ABZ766_19180 [Streptomyces sp. NPDC006670]|uniref:hypothetical protein n=1 Tax=Streptomyces sp. NPDC006670 TaxID=3154476 RepID=UPI0034067B95
MALVTVLILVAVPALVALLALAPSVPARRNPFPGRHRRTPDGRAPTRGLTTLPHQRNFRHHAR